MITVKKNIEENLAKASYRFLMLIQIEIQYFKWREFVNLAHLANESYKFVILLPIIFIFELRTFCTPKKVFCEILAIFKNTLKVGAMQFYF